MHLVYLGLGANLDNPVEQLNAAVQRLKSDDHLHQLRVSRYYASAPMGPQDQPDYVNAVVECVTSLSPLALLDLCQQIEHEHHRKRERRWGARTLDIDILSIDQLQQQDDRLTLPHPGIQYRDFVLKPWCELTQDYLIPGLGKVAEVALVDADYQAKPINHH